MKTAVNADFPPSKLDIGFKKWTERGLSIPDQLIEEETLKSLEQRQLQFGKAPTTGDTLQVKR